MTPRLHVRSAPRFPKKRKQFPKKRTKGSSLELSVPTYGCTGFCKRSCRKNESCKSARDPAGNLKIVKSRNKLNEFN